jgi:predicted RNA-binding Zn-ribbon protein involved in translation (DUF1610 family)
MYGRNGLDQLNLALIWICLITELVSSLLARFQGLSGLILSWISLGLWAWLLFRMFSRNVYRRRAENSRWMTLVWKVKNCGSGARERHADKTHKYFTCKSCKTICRVPVGKGKIVITCPKCGAQIHAKT